MYRKLMIYNSLSRAWKLISKLICSNKLIRTNTSN